MAVHGDVVLRQRICLGGDCHAVFYLCSHCDRGQRYCSLTCRQQARLGQRRCANRRYQRSPEGRLDHRDRQRQYRERQSQRASAARVTDQGSLLIACSASSTCGTAETARAEVADRAGAAVPRSGVRNQTGVWLRCRICGRPGRFFEVFPRIPRRR